jgi:hypothetical protein
MPLIAGASIGLIAAPQGGSSPISNLMKGDWEHTADALSCNYIGYSTYQGNWTANGRLAGSKGLAAGAIATKVLDWLL